MQGCSDLPFDKVEELIEETDNDGVEHAFVMCDGELEGEFVGDEDSLEFTTECGGEVVVFHTHPNDTLELSPQDRRVLENEGVNLMCVGDTEGNFVCEGGGYACAVDLDQYDDTETVSSGGGNMAVAEESECEWFK